MPFELFPASRSTERGKRKREDDDAEAAGNQKDSVVEGGKSAETATDEEVEEFFAIVKRLQAASKYIEKIDGASHLLMGKKFNMTKASQEEADEIGIRAEKIPEHKLNRNLDLDLNLEPASVESKGKEMRSRSQSQNLKPSAADPRRN